MSAAGTTTVVRLRRRGSEVVQDCDVYIGRAVMRGGWQLAASKWANPYTLGNSGGRIDIVLDRYEKHVRARPDLMASLDELRGKRLGCWCKPGPCHGDVLVRLLSEAQDTDDAVV